MISSRIAGFAVLASAILLASASAKAPEPTMEKPDAKAPSPEADRKELEEDLAELGVPSADLTGRILPGANLAQINSILNNIITARLTDSFQKSTLAAAQNTQQVLAALANSAAVPALSPSAKNQYETVMDLFRHPTFANPPQPSTTAAGRKLLASN